MKALFELWRGQQTLQTPGEEVLQSRIMTLSASQFAAIFAVDTHMSEDQFVKMCRENFKGAYERAPKFS